MNENKYDFWPNESLGVDGVEVLDVRLKSPDNPVKLMDGKLLVLKYKGK